MSEKQINHQRTLKARFEHYRNIVSKALTTTVFALFLWHGRLNQLKGVPANHNYWVITHSFDNGLLFMVLLVGIFGFYAGLSKNSTQAKRVAFLILGLGVWTAYTILFLIRDRLFPNPPSLQSVLVLAIAISFLIDLKVGDA